ncbi:MAG: ATP-dependent helicase HrpB [Planctomycetales bacterium]|nr:ATP-dependent helicase HrpB [Planctomycetales bacterium]
METTRRGPLIVTAPPGSGKTTLVPPALLDDFGSHSSRTKVSVAAGVWLVQPRRIAARAVARRIAHMRHTPLGAEVGYQVRFENETSPATRLTVMTTGILLRRLFDDVALEGIGAVVLDEFHERSVELDLALGMLTRIRDTIRPDLRIVIMSATLDAGPLCRLLPDASHEDIPGTCYPVEIRYLRSAQFQREPLEHCVAREVPEALRATAGNLLVFLPGVGEIKRCQQTLRDASLPVGCELLTLYGEQAADQQDRVLAPSNMRKVILATNIAETSLTIQGVTGVIDSGQARQLRVHPGTGVPRLERIAISRAAADQRAGRAGRTAPGVCWRLWDPVSHNSRPAEESPEILRTDLCGPLLQLAALGERDLNEFPWLTSPPRAAFIAASRTLVWLGALEPTEGNEDSIGNSDSEVGQGGRAFQLGAVTPLGKQLARLPVHPRLGRLLLAGTEHGVLTEAALVAALLSERDPFRQREAAPPRSRESRHSHASDVVERVRLLQQFREKGGVTDGELTCDRAAANHVIRVADRLRHSVAVPMAPRAADRDEALMRALLDAFPDRLARLRLDSRDRALMVGGRGVRLAAESCVAGRPLFLVVDVRDGSADAIVTIASAVQREWLPSHHLKTADQLSFNDSKQQVEARRRCQWGDLPLEESPAPILDVEAAAHLLATHAADDILQVLPDPDSLAGRFLARVRWLHGEFPGSELPSLDDGELCDDLPSLCRGLRSFDELRDADWLTYCQQIVGFQRLPEIDRLAPESIALPNDRRVQLSYAVGRAPLLRIKIQEIFGLQETPRVAGGRVPILLELLGPNFRPQQLTNDLPSFWQNTYPVIRKELRRRYPKHAWPENPPGPSNA